MDERVDLHKAFIICLEAVLSLSAAIPLGTSTKRADFLKEIITVGLHQAASVLWTGSQLFWHINCLELLAVHLALRQFRTTAIRQACVGPYG